MQYINGVDHLLAEYDIHRDLVLPIHRAIQNLPKDANTSSFPVPGAVFVQEISGGTQ